MCHYKVRKLGLMFKVKVLLQNINLEGGCCICQVSMAIRCTGATLSPCSVVSLVRLVPETLRIMGTQ